MVHGLDQHAERLDPAACRRQRERPNRTRRSSPARTSTSTATSARTGELSSGIARFDTVTPDDTPGFGTVMHLQGVIAHGPTASGNLTRIFGNADTDQIFFDKTFLGGTSGTATFGSCRAASRRKVSHSDRRPRVRSADVRLFGRRDPRLWQQHADADDHAIGTMTFAPDAGGDTITRTPAAGSTGWLCDRRHHHGRRRHWPRTIQQPHLHGHGRDRDSADAERDNFVKAETVDNVALRSRIPPRIVRPTGDSEDFFVVNQLQSMASTRRPQRLRRDRRHADARRAGGFRHLRDQHHRHAGRRA